MKKTRLSLTTKLSLAATAALLLVGVIFLISPRLASDDPGDCSVEGEALKAIQPAASPTPLPDIAFADADGKPVTPADFRGRGLVVNFWATWCAPCVREMPELDALKADLAAEGIDVIAVSMDRAGLAAVTDFFAERGIRNLEPLLDQKSQAGRTLGIRGLPTTLIVDRESREVARITGLHHYDTDETRAYLKRCIGGG